MSRLNMTSCTEFHISGPRRKARRSCLYCQRAHKTCGNERPCGQCVKRNMPSECVDGYRKPPKYLNEGIKKPAKAGLHRGVTSPRQTKHQKEDILSTASYDNEIIGQEASDEGQTQDHRRKPFDDVFDEFIDSTFFCATRSSSKFKSRSSGGTTNDSSIPFLSNSEHSTWTETCSSTSEDSEVGTPERDPEDSFTVNLEKLHQYTRDEPCSGFAISSGWSSTFFPHGIDEKHHDC